MPSLSSSSSHPSWYKRVVGLIDQGAHAAGALPGTAAELAAALQRARAVLQSLSAERRDGLLLLSAARIHVESAQQLCRSLILGDVVGDVRLDSEQLSRLVQLRQLCLEVIPLLNTALDDARRQRRM